MIRNVVLEQIIHDSKPRASGDDPRVNDNLDVNDG